MAATKQELEALHALVAKSFNVRIQQDLEDNLPTDAATLGAAIKFLKDNSISADPATSDDLQEIRNGLIDQAAAREQRRADRKSMLTLVHEDLKQAQGG